MQAMLAAFTASFLRCKTRPGGTAGVRASSHSRSVACIPAASSGAAPAAAARCSPQAGLEGSASATPSDTSAATTASEAAGVSGACAASAVLVRAVDAGVDVIDGAACGGARSLAATYSRSRVTSAVPPPALNDAAMRLLDSRWRDEPRRHRDDSAAARELRRPLWLGASEASGAAFRSACNAASVAAGGMLMCSTALLVPITVRFAPERGSALETSVSA